MDRPPPDRPPSENAQRATAIMNVLSLSPSNGVAYLQAGAGLERMSQFRQSVDVLRTAVRLLPRHARAYDRLGLVLYKAAMHVEWSVFRDQPGLQQPPDRLPGDEDMCWRAAEPNCFQIEHYGPSQLHVAEADFLRRVEKSKTDTRGVLLLGRLLRNCSVNASVQSIRLDPRRVTPYLTLAHVLPVGGSPALYRRALQLDPTQGDVYLWHGDALHRLRYYKQANTAYRAALALRPGSVRAYLALAEVRLEVRKPDDAYRMAEAASQLQEHAQERGGGSGGGGGGKGDDEDEDDWDDGATSERVPSSMGVGEAEEAQAATLALNLTRTRTRTRTRARTLSRT